MIRVLQICNKPPLPKIDGGCVAINNICEGLINHSEVELKILTVETEKHPFIKENYPSSYIKKAKIEAVYIDTRVNYVDAFSSYITSDSYNVIRFFSPSFDKKIREVLEENQYDIVHIESLFITPYIHTIRRFSKAKIVLRAHNIEHKLWEEKSKESKNPLKKIYLSFLYKKLKQYETNVLKNIDAIAAISDSDKVYLEKLTDKKISNIPLGISLKSLKNKTPNEVVKFFHIGAMDWLPNKEAIDWFLDEVWEILLKENPNIELHLAGKNISKDYHLPHINVFCHGEVESAEKFMQKHDVLIIPLKTASGLRIKIVEAMAQNKLVVSSTVGIRGIKAKSDIHFLEANSLKEYKRVVDVILNQPKLTDEIRSNSLRLIEKEFDKTIVINKLVELYKSLI